MACAAPCTVNYHLIWVDEVPCLHQRNFWLHGTATCSRACEPRRGTGDRHGAVHGLLYRYVLEWHTLHAGAARAIRRHVRRAPFRRLFHRRTAHRQDATASRYPGARAKDVVGRGKRLAGRPGGPSADRNVLSVQGPPRAAASDLFLPYAAGNATTQQREASRSPDRVEHRLGFSSVSYVAVGPGESPRTIESHRSLLLLVTRATARCDLRTCMGRASGARYVFTEEACRRVGQAGARITMRRGCAFRQGQDATKLARS